MAGGGASSEDGQMKDRQTDGPTDGQRAGGQMDRRTDAASANVNNGGNSSSARALPGTEPLAYVHATFVAVWEEGVSS